MYPKLILALAILVGISWYTYHHYYRSSPVDHNKFKKYYQCSQSPDSTLQDTNPKVCHTKDGHRFVDTNYSFYLQYLDSQGEFQFNYPNDWHLINEQFWDNNPPGTFNRFAEFGPDFSTYSTIILKTFNNIEPGEISTLAAQYLYPVHPEATLEVSQGTILGSDTIYALERDDTTKEGRGLITFFQCGSTLYSFEYLGQSDSWTNLGKYRDILLSFECKGINQDTQIPNLPDVLAPYLK